MRWTYIMRNPSQNAAFFTKSEHMIKQAVALSSPVSTVYARNAWVFTSLLMLFTCCGIRQGKLASLQQVSSPNSQDNFQICCADMYLVRFLVNFAGFCVILWISRDFVDLLEIRGSTTARNIRRPVYMRNKTQIFTVCFTCKSTLTGKTSTYVPS